VDAPRTTPCTPSDLGGEHEGIDWDGGIVVESKHVVLAKVATPLWEHQRRAVQAVCDGLQAGKLGFADASSVGAGKTLTALGCVTAVWRRMQTKGLQLRGVLVLLPTQDLILEWELQVEKHLANVRLIVQAATGHLSTKGVAMSGKWGRVDHPVATIVVTTLARAREHPFRNHEGWDFVVVDECLSVQNDTALQTMECWRQVAASSNGVLMLSATFFRSKFSKLFYMIQMLRSPLPRTLPYLTTLLQEHIVCFVPESRRRWQVSHIPFYLSDETRSVYLRMLQSQRARDPRSLFAGLKGYLSSVTTTLVVAAAIAEVSRLQALGRRPLVFANSDREAAALASAIPQARRWGGKQKRHNASCEGCDRCKAGPSQPGNGPVVLSIHQGAYGLNLQFDADCIVCRPTPGDVLEQMRGRIDRPGQTQDSLFLSLLYAAGTIEEAETQNISLCGAFFRQYLHPLSSTFQEVCVESALNPMEGEGAIGRSFLRRVAGLSTPDEPVLSAMAPIGDASVVLDITEDVPNTQHRRRGKLKRRTSSTLRIKPTAQKPQGFEVIDLDEDDWPAVPRRLDTRALEVGTAWLAARDDRVAELIAQVGPPTGLLDSFGGCPFRALVRSIVYQLLSIKAAGVIYERLGNRCGGAAELTPLAASNLSEQQMRDVGLSFAKARSIHALSRKFLSGEWSAEILAEWDDDTAMKELCSVKGLGEWSVHMFLMFNQGRGDILPVGDLAVRKAFRRVYGLSAHHKGSAGRADGEAAAVESLPGPKAMEAVARCWRPFRTIGTWYMWHAVETEDAAYV